MGQAELQDLVEDLHQDHPNVPGVSVAVLADGTVAEAAAGIANKRTGVEATTDTLFQIGSISKVFTATLLMQLVDEGQVELDKPVRAYLPEFTVADRSASESITVRQLLSHTSGVADHFGDLSVDCGRGDDCLRRYVEGCVTAPQVGPPGAFQSYSNLGYLVTGRMIERLRAATWDVALQERLLDRLDCRHTFTLPEDIVMHRVAVGHTDPTGSGTVSANATWGLPRWGGPTGGIVSTARDLLRFAQMHLADGVGPDGSIVLSPESAHAMRAPQVELLDRWAFGNSAWGLGWMIFDWGGREVVGHDGNTVGQSAFLRLVPDAGFAVALVTNGLHGRNFSRSLFKHLIKSQTGIDVPQTPNADAPLPTGAAHYAGTYEHLHIRTEIANENDGLVASTEFGGVLDDMWPKQEREQLRAIDDTTFLVHLRGWDEDSSIRFFDFDEMGRPRYIHRFGFAHPRVER